MGVYPNDLKSTVKFRKDQVPADGLYSVVPFKDTRVEHSPVQFTALATAVSSTPPQL